MDNVKDFEEALIQERKKSDVLTQRMHELETFISDLLVQQEEEEAKLEGTEKSRELLEAQLQQMLLQVSCELQAKAAAELQVQKRMDRIHISALQNSIRIVPSTNPGLNGRSDNYSSNWQWRQIMAKLSGINWRQWRLN